MRRMTVDGPQPGNWFAVAFITWTDPNNERIEQQGKINIYSMPPSLPHYSSQLKKLVIKCVAVETFCCVVYTRRREEESLMMLMLFCNVSHPLSTFTFSLP